MRDRRCDKIHELPSRAAAEAEDVSRRSLLRWSAFLAAGGVATLVPASIASAATSGTPGQKETTTYKGTAPFGFDQWISIELDIPAGVQRISVSYSFEPQTSPSLPGTWNNVMDIGILGPTEFRGYSGSARKEFTLSAADATPGYVPGPIQQGKWSIILGPMVAELKGMGWQVDVTLDYGDPLPTTTPYDVLPASIPNTGWGWYRGDLHMHTVHSDSQRTVDERVADAHAADLDFIAISDHNTNAAGVSWRGNIPKRMLVINAEEVTTRHGHWLAVGIPQGDWIDWRYKPSDGKFDANVQQVRGLGGLVIAAHPMTPAFGSAWEFGLGLDKIDAMEVWNGAPGSGTRPWTGDDELNLIAWHLLLCAGKRVPGLGNSDAHSLGDGLVGTPQNVVCAKTLSKAALLDAIRRGRLYVAESSQVTVDFTASARGTSAGPGETLPLGFFDAVDVVAKISGAPNTVATLVTEWGVMASIQIDAGGSGVLRWRGWGKASMFARVDVRRMEPSWSVLSQMVAFTNPIWFYGTPTVSDPNVPAIRLRGHATPEIPFGTSGTSERALPGITHYTERFAAASVSLATPPPPGRKTALTIGDDQHLYLTVMRWNGMWAEWLQVPNPGGAADLKFQTADLAGMPDGTTQYLATGMDGILYHQTGDASMPGRLGQFSGFQPVPGTDGSPTWRAAKVAAEGMPDGTTQVLTYRLDGSLYHNIRRTDGSWVGWTRLAGYSVTPAFAGTALSMVGMSDGSSQILAIGLDGLVYHQIRYPDGRFTGFRQVQGIKGPTMAASSVDIALDTYYRQNSVRVAAVGQDGNVWYVTRMADGSWNDWQQATTSTSKGFPYARVVITPGDAWGNKYVALSTL
ncbi:CehA/McbA family metallohydrolase [Streptomyces sp. NBC_01017]|uniref:CehA/McbA family metallohydrolase n=1 Tax=Streptomyces sp. NBC_01017 TaxID=2903721 RepID=UPI0038695A12|nr:CehA/McbA family metallohydrolase [Streptomyces sp. NBC_01017]WSV35242.1 CehA/McbA family metallohydrolase [Streptomyces sp. NBC_01017]